MSEIHVWQGTYDQNGLPELQPLHDDTVIQMTASQLRRLCADSMGIKVFLADAAQASSAAVSAGDAVKQLVEHLAAQAEPTTKPFAAPGRWFPTTITGHPIRHLDPAIDGRLWEAAQWPSDGVTLVEPDTGRVFLAGVGAYPDSL